MDSRPHQASALHRVEVGGLGNDSHPCSLSLSQGHMGVPDNQAAIQEAESTMANPFPFYNAKENWVYKWHPCLIHVGGSVVL